VVVVSTMISVGVVVFCFWKNTKDPARTTTTTRVIMSKNVFVKPCLFIYFGISGLNTCIYEV